MSVALENLIAGTTYSYKWTASNSGGTADEKTGTFTTGCFETTPDVEATTPGSGNAQFEWDPIAGASQYLLSLWTGTAGTKTDTLTIEDMKAGAGGYPSVSGISASSGSEAIYAGVVNSNNESQVLSIQMRTSDGLYTTTSGGTLASISVTWNNANGNGYKIYGKKGEFSGISDTSSGEEIGTLNASTTTLTPAANKDYTHVLIKPTGGWSRAASITLVWNTMVKAYPTGGAGGSSVTVGQEIHDLPVTSPVTVAGLTTDPETTYGWELKAVGGSCSTSDSGTVTPQAAMPAVEVTTGDPAVPLTDGESTVTWGSCEIAAGAVTKTFTVANTGNAALETLGTPTVTAGQGFTVDATGMASSLDEEGGTTDSTTFTVTFTPTDAMSGGVTKTAEVSFTHGAEGSPFTFTVTATVPAATLESTQSSLTGFQATYGNNSSAKSFTLRNGAHLTSDPVTLELTGANAGDFAIKLSSGAASTYAGSASVASSAVTPPNTTAFNVRLKNTASVGQKTAAVTISGGGLATPLTVNLSGEVFKMPTVEHSSATATTPRVTATTLDFSATAGHTTDTSAFRYTLTAPEGLTEGTDYKFDSGSGIPGMTTEAGDIWFAALAAEGTYQFTVTVANTLGATATFRWTVTVTASTYSTADRIVNSYIVLNGTWYNGSGTGNNTLGNLGTIDGLTIAGQAQTYGDQSAAAHVVEMMYSLHPSDAGPSTWNTANLAWWKYQSNNNWHQSGGDTLTPGPASGFAALAAGTYKVSVYFRQQTGATTYIYDSNNNDNYVATFTVAATLGTSESSLGGFATTYATASGAQSFTVTGTHLTGDLTVTAPSGYQVSLSETTGYSADGGTLTLPRDGNNMVDGTTVWVRLSTSAASVFCLSFIGYQSLFLFSVNYNM